MLPRGSHAGLIEHPELLNLRLEKFIAERILARRPGVRKKAKKSTSKRRARTKTPNH